MHRLVPVLALILAAPAAAQMPGQPNPRLVTAGTYRVDTNHTQVTWSVNHLGFSMLQGQFGASGGQAVIDPARPAANKVEVTFDVSQMSVTSAPFATHLKSKDFFDVAAHPTARFVSRSVAIRGDAATVTGDLTIKGITKPVTLQATFVGAGPNPRSKKTNFGFRATGTINRSDFGLGMAAPAVSDRVALEINAAFEAA
ncbi:MAG TPA: YceI family protein [Sphingomonas sp.]|jgi:polyisoprenoid-binding protein YceI|uniref:YceI family protein n=1 Tax=Sphingomonas sp. TaxID=28214 RepID=UPI002ED900D0